MRTVGVLGLKMNFTFARKTPRYQRSYLTTASASRLGARLADVPGAEPWRTGRRTVAAGSSNRRNGGGVNVRSTGRASVIVGPTHGTRRRDERHSAGLLPDACASALFRPLGDAERRTADLHYNLLTQLAKFKVFVHGTAAEQTNQACPSGEKIHIVTSVFPLQGRPVEQAGLERTLVEFPVPNVRLSGCENIITLPYNKMAHIFACEYVCHISQHQERPPDGDAPFANLTQDSRTNQTEAANIRTEPDETKAPRQRLRSPYCMLSTAAASVEERLEQSK